MVCRDRYAEPGYLVQIFGRWMLPHGTLVLGGAASGKSEYAENLFHNSELNLIYLATGQIFDAEVAERVETHRARRDARWQTIEAPFDPGSPLAKLSEEDGVLIIGGGRREARNGETIIHETARTAAPTTSRAWFGGK